MTKPVVMDIAPTHYGEILKINQDNVEMLSPLTEEEFTALLGMAALRKAVMADGQVAAFLIALREGCLLYTSAAMTPAAARSQRSSPKRC